MTAPSAIEREIIERIVAAKIRLRFDKAVLRLVSGLKAALAEVIPEGQTLIFTVTAPIILTPIDQNLCAHWRRPMDMMVHGCATSLFQE
jgi:hypothetical protein